MNTITLDTLADITVAFIKDDRSTGDSCKLIADVTKECLSKEDLSIFRDLVLEKAARMLAEALVELNDAED